MTPIDERPDEVNERRIPSQWEGDLIKGAMNRSRVGTLVERTTLFVVLVRLDDGRAETTVNGFAAVLNRFQSPMRLSMNYDQGREMAPHRSLAGQTGVRVYFAQRPVSKIPPQRKGPQRLLPAAAGRDRHAPQGQATKVPRLEGSPQSSSSRKETSTSYSSGQHQIQSSPLHLELESTRIPPLRCGMINGGAAG